MKRKSILATACIIAFVGAMPVFAAKTLIKDNALASYYGAQYHGRPTSSGEIFDMYGMTASHRTLPFGTMLEITNLENGKSVVVRVNDRGPFVEGREIDVSLGAAEKLGMITSGVARVSISILDESEAATKTALTESSNAAPQAVPPAAATALPVSSTPSESTLSEYLPVSSQPDAAEPVLPLSSMLSELLAAPAQSDDAAEPVLPLSSTVPEYLPVPSQPDATTTTAAQSSPVQSSPADPDTALTPAPAPAPAWTMPLLASEKAPADPDSPLWRIQVGAFSREENAIRLVRVLRAAGLEPAYERSDGTIRVVLAAVEERKLESVKSALRDAGIYDYILRRER